MSLSQFEIKNAKPKEKVYKLFDTGGLYLSVELSGSRFWRMKYTLHGKEKTLTFGNYPLIGLAEARIKRDEIRKQLLDGKDPAVEKQLEKLNKEIANRNTFLLIADEYMEHARQQGTSEATLKRNKWLITEIAKPICNRPIAELQPIEILSILKSVEKTGRRETAHRLRTVIGSICRFAVVTLRATTDPTQMLKGALLKVQTKPRAAILDEKELGGLLRSIDSYKGWIGIKAALQFTALTCCRPGEVRGAVRSEFDFEKKSWKIPAERMKMRRVHEVPLSRQAIALLEEIWFISERGNFVFPSHINKEKKISENGMNVALRRMGYTKEEMTSHGFRASASTIMNERDFKSDVVEAILSHQDENQIRRAYNRSTYWNERIIAMQNWADLLDEFKEMK